MVVKYEDLKKNVDSEVMMMLDFLDYPYSLNTLKRLKIEYDEFQRRHLNMRFEHFTHEQKLFLKTVIHNTIHVLDSHRLTQACDIRDYLQHV